MFSPTINSHIRAFCNYNTVQLNQVVFRFYIAFLFLILLNLGVSAQEVTISGIVKDSISGELLIGANCISENGIGVATNNYGFFSITIANDQKELLISYIGYEDKIVNVSTIRGEKLFISLNPEQLDVVEIVAQSRSNHLSQHNVPQKLFDKVPVILGEQDPLKTLQLMPGIQSGPEGFANLFVRGGSSDQNLITIDGSPIYNSTHVFGLFSVLNPDVVKNVKVYKGAFPARYGGRLSSVLDFRFKEGSNERIKGKYTIGLLSAKGLIEGPISKKTTFLLAGRRSYLDILAIPAVKAEGRIANADLGAQFFFNDINAKLKHNVSENHTLYLSAYRGRDKYGFTAKEEKKSEEVSLEWINFISTLRWNWILGNKLFLNTSLNVSDYNLDIFGSFEQKNEQEEESFTSTKFISGIRDVSLNFDFDYQISNKNYLRFGSRIIQHIYNPSGLTIDQKFDNSDLKSLLSNNTISALQTEFYIENEYSIDKLTVNGGLRGGLFSTGGVTYNSIQPRILLEYKVSPKIDISTSYSRMQQFINLLANDSYSLPTDIWVPSYTDILPQTGDVYTTGLSTSLSEDLDLQGEAFYKSLQNVVALKDGESFLINVEDDWQSKVTQGSGLAYGVELMLTKSTGRLNGFASYTYSKSERTFESLNGGKTFPFKYDRRHDISLTLNYEINDKVEISGNWIYFTGHATSLPSIKQLSAYRFDNDGLGFYFTTQEVGIQLDRNSFRVSATHRLDLSCKWNLGDASQNDDHKYISFGLYNVYANKNPNYITLDIEGDFNAIGRFVETNRSFKEVSFIPFPLPYISFTNNF